MMTQRLYIRSENPRLSIKIGTTIALAITIGMPLQAQETVVEGKVQRSDLIQERVAYNDLDLREQPNQLILISRVRKAAGRVCDIIYRGEHPMAKFESRCPQRTYINAKPQIDLAFANAQNGKQIAMSFVVARSR